MTFLRSKGEPNTCSSSAGGTVAPAVNSSPLAELPLEELLAQVAEPLERAQAIPPWAYTDPRFLELEQQRIFSASWLCVGRASSLGNAGDYLATEVAGEPVIVIRTNSGDIKAMSNVCRHRMSTLLEGRGNADKIVCPYHAWTYELDGHLRGAPAMDRNQTFRKESVCLPHIRCEVWSGWVFLTLDAAIPPPAETFVGVEDLIGHYHMENYVETFREEFKWQGNWKLVAENFMESYHLPTCHAGTVGRSVRLRELDDTVDRDTFNYHCIVRDDGNELTVAHASNTQLTGDLRRTTWVMALYPSLMITLSPGYFWYLCFAPDGPSAVDVVFGGGMAPEFSADERAESIFAGTREMTSAIIAEDRLCVERVYCGMNSSLATPGPLSHLEGGNHAFMRWIVSKVVG